MKSLLTRISIAAFGLTLITAPLAARADQWHDGRHDDWHRAPVYAVHRGYWREGHWHAYGRPHYVEGYYGWAPGGYYGYYHAGRWFAHRRWGGGFWIYF